MKLSRFWVFLLLVALAIPTFVFSQSNSGWNTQTTTATFGFGSQKFNSQLASVFKVQVPFPVYVSGKITIVVAPWWLLVLVFMIFYPIIDIITGFVPPFSKATEMGSKGVERSKTVFTIGFSVLAMFVTPLVPYVVQLVTVGTTMGVWWFWMLLFMMFIWGVNWLFGESAFGDPFRKGAAGLGHIGSAGITKLRKHWGKEMSDTTNETYYKNCLQSLMTRNINLNDQEKELINNLKSILNQIVGMTAVGSIVVRDALDTMLQRLKELEHYFVNEKKLDMVISSYTQELEKINKKIDSFKNDISNLQINILNVAVTLGKNLNQKPDILMNRPIKSLNNKSFNAEIKELQNRLNADTNFDSDQSNLTELLQKLNSRSVSLSNRELAITTNLIRDIEQIKKGTITVHVMKTFISRCSKALDELYNIEMADCKLLTDARTLRQNYDDLLKKEINTAGFITQSIATIKNALRDCITQKNFS